MIEKVTRWEIQRPFPDEKFRVVVEWGNYGKTIVVRKNFNLHPTDKSGKFELEKAMRDISARLAMARDYRISRDETIDARFDVDALEAIWRELHT